MLHREPIADRLDAGSRAGSAVDRHDAVGALSGAAQQTAAAVILEAAREGALAGGIQGGGDRVALVGLHLLSVEREAELALAVQALAGLLCEPTHSFARRSGLDGGASDGREVNSTSLVVVSRSAT